MTVLWNNKIILQFKYIYSIYLVLFLMVYLTIYYLFLNANKKYSTHLQKYVI